VLTKNFSGAEIEGLVRAAQSTALNRLIKASSKVEVDPEAGEKLMVDRKDFLHAFENDIKPVIASSWLLIAVKVFYWSALYILWIQAFGNSAEALDLYISRGIISWGPPVTSVFEYGTLLTQQARSGFGNLNVAMSLCVIVYGIILYFFRSRHCSGGRTTKQW